MITLKASRKFYRQFAAGLMAHKSIDKSSKKHKKDKHTIGKKKEREKI
jgi:hypothetical protein